MKTIGYIEISATTIQGVRHIMKRIYPNYVIDRIRYTGKRDNITGGKYYKVEYHYRNNNSKFK